ncbi:MAG TPA: putative toxin-antitoxin system toxin component, PIN family [Burkholderiales bacterium]|nr:putative toxin-antitoxin system toxin component, PIN family [Burkholderiales bacterium]
MLDTNVAVSALVFQQGTMTWFREAWQSVFFAPLVDQHAIQEVIRVLGYPRFNLGDEDVRQLLGDYLPYAEVVIPSGKLAKLPLCRDPDDQPFLVLAQAGKADVLVTGDQALLELEGKTAFGIEAPAAFRRRFP